MDEEESNNNINNKPVCRPSSSFRLHSPSLNSLRLRRIFDMFDKNGDEMITVEELSQALDLLGLEAEFSELESIMHAYIKPDKTGLEFDDFEALHQALGDTYFGGSYSSERLRLEQEEGLSEEQEESDLTEAFKVFDEDGDGYISAKELQVVLEKLGLPEASEMDRVQKMIFSVDRNQDGRVDFHEFKDMMLTMRI